MIRKKNIFSEAAALAAAPLSRPEAGRSCLMFSWAAACCTLYAAVLPHWDPYAQLYQRMEWEQCPLTRKVRGGRVGATPLLLAKVLVASWIGTDNFSRMVYTPSVITLQQVMNDWPLVSADADRTSLIKDCPPFIYHFYFRHNIIYIHSVLFFLYWSYCCNGYVSILKLWECRLVWQPPPRMGCDVSPFSTWFSSIDSLCSGCSMRS